VEALKPSEMATSSCYTFRLLALLTSTEAKS
jgi:hypothetical protein